MESQEKNRFNRSRLLEWSHNTSRPSPLILGGPPGYFTMRSARQVNILIHSTFRRSLQWKFAVFVRVFSCVGFQPVNSFK